MKDLRLAASFARLRCNFAGERVRTWAAKFAVYVASRFVRVHYTDFELNRMAHGDGVAHHPCVDSCTSCNLLRLLYVRGEVRVCVRPRT